MFKPEGSLAVIGKKKCWVWHLWDVLWDEAITHRKFDDCENGPATGKSTPNRKFGHMLLVYSFAILAFVTAVVAVGHWGGKVIPLIHIETPMRYGTTYCSRPAARLWRTKLSRKASNTSSEGLRMHFAALTIIAVD